MWTSRINKLFYVALLGWFLIFSLPPSYKFAVYTPNFLGYCMISLFFISILALLFLLIYRIVKQGFFTGIKASSLNIFSMLLILTASFFILKAYVRVANKITVDVYNGSAFKISNIKLLT